MLAREFDPKGERTLGVLTKADTVQEGEHDTWLRFMQNAGSEYFVTCSSGEAARKKNPTFAEARAAERTFFQNTEPWVSQKQLKDRLGTGNLTTFLSIRLSEYISQKCVSIVSIRRFFFLISRY